jgi:hypothetical protein
LTVPEDAVHESATLGAPEPELPVAAAASVIDNCAEAVFPAESVTVKVKVLVPALAGVPEKTPAEVKVIPVLQAPLQEGSVQVYGAVPPVAANVVEYAVPTVPAGSEAVVIASVDDAVAAAAIVIDNCAEAVWLAESVTVKVKVLVPAFTGVPDKTPAELNAIPVLQEPLQEGSVQV